MQFSVEVARSTLRQVGYVVAAPGTMQAFEQVQVTARVGRRGRQGRLRRRAGGQAGQVLVGHRGRPLPGGRRPGARPRSTRRRRRRAQAEAELARRQQAVAEHPGLVAGEEVETYQTSVATAKADVRAAREALRVAQLNLRDSYVRAPIAGRHPDADRGDGAVPRRRAPSWRRSSSATPRSSSFGVTEADAPRLTVGMTANFTLRESPRTYTAKITLVAGSAEPASRLVPGHRRDRGDGAQVLAPARARSATCNVPVGDTRQAAVIPELSMQRQRARLLVVRRGRGGRRASAASVQLGMHTADGFVEVTQGLAAGRSPRRARRRAAERRALPVKIANRTTLEAFDAGGRRRRRQRRPRRRVGSPRRPRSRRRSAAMLDGGPP